MGTVQKYRMGGNCFGTHRSKEPVGSLPQQATVLDASLPIYENELLIEVESLNIDSASFHQIKSVCGSSLPSMESHILNLVRSQGKHQNPVTGSGGMLIGTVADVGPKFEFKDGNLKKGDRIATLVSLTLTPLHIEKIKKIHLNLDRVDISGHAVLFTTGIYSKLPSDIPESLALAILDVCGAPAQTAELCKPGDTVVVIGGAGKSGVLCLYEAAKAVGPKGKVIALDYSTEAVNGIRSLSFVKNAFAVDARDALAVYEIVNKATDGKMADLVINVANIPDTEMSCVLASKQGGVAYYFSMATSFTKATLGAEGVGADVELIMGNGYRPGHADLALNILRQAPEIRKMYETKYGAS